MANAEPFELSEPVTTRTRAVLAKRLADIVGLPSSRITPRERWIVGDLLFDVIRASDVDLRKRCAKRLSGLTDAPHRLLRTLACDEYEVAEPILADCLALSDFDMMEIARVGKLQHRLALANRENLSATVSASLAAAGETPVIERLLRNKTCVLAMPTVDHLVGMAAEEGNLAHLLIKREELRPTQAFRLFWTCEHMARAQILERFAVDRTILIDASEDIFPMAAAEDWSDPMVTRILRYIDRRQRNREAAELSPYGSLEGTLEAMAMDGALPEIVTEISTLANVDRRLVLQMVDDMAGEAIAVLCKATGLKWPSFENFWRGLGRSLTSEPVPQARKVYDSLSVEKAQTVLRYWNLSMEDKGGK
ncbi:DUF2336 domain-containing protein [Maricaulis maris]|jgi:uncharacterized protein (DUF2336 family)|uniref:DUF2336 domain-containing protein n=1 Tax=Maricaulis maris TaxID=74318 RepID=UPI0026EA14D8|nr:DUF2336 domain-containing protein [Maricaulis maris]